MTLFPLVEALSRGDSMGVGLTLGGIAAGVGGNLVAEQVQRWKDRVDRGGADEGEAAREAPHLLPAGQRVGGEKWTPNALQ
jgi:hypothetical protein